MNVIYSDLANKCVLVTGATRGIGKTIVEELAKNKAHVVFNYRSDVTVANELKDHLLALGACNVSALNFDMNNTDQMKTAIDHFMSEGYAISGLVNNAGISKDQLVLRVKPEDIANIINTNLNSTMILTNMLTRHFLKTPDVSIVNMSSIVGLMGNTAQTVYAASKAGLIGYTKSLAKELASRSVRCNAICPGFIETEMTKTLPEKVQAEYKSAIPLGAYGSTQDVANLTLFLLSQASSYITGEVIKVDGGLYI